MFILKYITKFILWIAGWKITGPLPEKKSIVVMAPHTSNLDFLMGWLGYTSLGIKSHFLIKKEVFKWYSSGMIKAMGGIPVDRSHSSNVVLQVAEEFNRRDKFVVTITPEGTRKLNNNWKRGFYFIALSAKVPISLGFLDYKKKEGGFGVSFIPSGDFDKDFTILKEFYSTKSARYPEKFNLTSTN
ncbi:MAG TPA: 1-acyl-sn-glycerol-3-phosphate acyltransferase [Lentimicrobium sp.]|nr:1-acyl-sn-glycerol-3-phosphate acyltransferase [Lentimicrobium sp.]